MPDAMSGILSDTEIRAAVASGDIEIDPYDSARVNPVSYDLTLGNEVAVYSQWVRPDRALSPEGVEDGTFFKPVEYGLIDVREEPEVNRFKISPTRGWLLNPGIGYLMHVRERVHTKIYVPILDGKSSVGRLFIQVHATAGFGDPGFNGQFTLEVIAQHPVRVYPGMPIAQIRFQTIEGRVSKPYDQTGKYTGEAAVGAVPSQLYRAFK